MRATIWNPTAHADYDVLTGKDVYSVDGEKVGSIAEVFHPSLDMPAARGRHYFLLDPGLLKDWFAGFDQVYLPESAIAEVTPDRVTLDLTAEQVKRSSKEWTREPADFATYQRTSVSRR